jgi:Protein of unknown function (DUF1566)
MTITIEHGITIETGIQIGNFPLYPPPTVIGQAYGGGYYAGQISTSGDGIADYYLIIGPVATTQTTLQWKTANTDSPGTGSQVDGLLNTNNMNNASHPAAQFCKSLSVGGFTDWYLPAFYELEICYYNLKPSTNLNTTNTGNNPNAVPPRNSQYNSGVPTQTTATIFQTGGAEAFTAQFYWASTQSNASNSSLRNFTNGQLSSTSKNNSRLLRAMRRVPV